MERVTFYIKDQEHIKKINEYRYKYGLSFNLAVSDILTDYLNSETFDDLYKDTIAMEETS